MSAAPSEQLNPDQYEAVHHVNGPLLVVAGAGSGKTRVLTQRIAHLINTGVHPMRILAITFTNKAASEMRERLHRLLPHAQGGMPLATTFHALGARLLREFHAEARLPRGFVIWDRDDSIRAIKKICERLDIGEPTPRAILSGISRRKGEGATARELAGNAGSFRERTIAQVWQAYDEALAAEGALDFDDLLGRTLTLVRDNEAVRSKLQARWRYLTVDEYQDTNGAQDELVRLLAGAARNVCVVGDGDQNIYSWRGAQMEHLLRFEEQYPGAKVVLLEQNYRSTRTILSVANAVIKKNRNRREKNLFTENETGEPVHVYDARNDIDEAWFVAQTAAALIETGTRPGEIAVLYRENFQSRVLEEALLAHSVPYRVLGVRFFERAEVKDVLSYLRAALNPHARQDIARCAAVPPRGIGKVTLEKLFAGETLGGAAGAKVARFQENLAKIAHAVHTLPASEAVRFVVEESGLEALFKEDTERGEERSANVRELVNLAVRYDGETSPDGIERLLEEAALQSEQDSLEGHEERMGLSLMTVHASKGLEFDAVFITGLEQGLFPSLREGDGTRDPEEERRLFYVAVTRARKRLFLSYAHERLKYGERERTLPSEFLADIDDRLSVRSRPKRSLLDEPFID